MPKSLIISGILAALFVAALMYFSQDGGDFVDGSNSSNIEIKDGFQYVYIDARGGYFPRNTVARANMMTKVVVKTNGTYDCSAALVVPQVSFRKILEPVGSEIIEVGEFGPGEKLKGLCSMGMYNFQILFE